MLQPQYINKLNINQSSKTAYWNSCFTEFMYGY